MEDIDIIVSAIEKNNFLSQDEKDDLIIMLKDISPDDLKKIAEVVDNQEVMKFVSDNLQHRKELFLAGDFENLGKLSEDEKRFLLSLNDISE